MSLSSLVLEIFALRLESCRKSHRFLDIFALPNFKGAVPLKFVLALTPNIETRQVPKFRQATPPNSEVISANLLHFKPIFDPPLKKSCKGGPRSRWGVRL